MCVCVFVLSLGCILDIQLGQLNIPKKRLELEGRAFESRRYLDVDGIQSHSVE